MGVSRHQKYPFMGPQGLNNKHDVLEQLHGQPLFTWGERSFLSFTFQNIHSFIFHSLEIR